MQGHSHWLARLLGGYRWLPVLSVIVLTGCALLRGSPPAATFVAPPARQIRFAAGFQAPRVKAVAYRNPSEYEEYDRVLGAAQAEVILSIANGPQTALEFPAYRLHALSKSWLFNRQAARIEWQPTKYPHIDGRAFTYARYTRHSGKGARHCVAFLRRWARPPDDPRQRPGKAFFGYYCAAAGQLLNSVQVINMLRGLVVSSQPVPRVYYGYSRARDTGALEAARGGSHANTGNPRFPFDFSRYYRIGNGSQTIH